MEAPTLSQTAATTPAGGYECRRQRRRDGERGQGMTEYGLILVLIAIVVILVVAVVGHKVNNIYSNVSSGLNT
jgi:pilus assembly protein Flp/PilA